MANAEGGEDQSGGRVKEGVGRRYREGPLALARVSGLEPRPHRLKGSKANASEPFSR